MSLNCKVFIEVFVREAYYASVRKFTFFDGKYYIKFIQER